MLARRIVGSLLVAGHSASLVVLAPLSGCASQGPSDGGLDGSGGTPTADGRYVIEDPEQDCDDVEGLRGTAILAALGLDYEGEISWSDLETGYEASRSVVHVEATIDSGGTFTCIPFRQYPGEPADYARLSYERVSLSMTTDDGLLAESGSAVAWLAETSSVGVLTLDVVRALPVKDAIGSFEVSPILDERYENLVLVYTPDEATPLGHVSVTSEPVASVLEDGDVGTGVPHGFFPALP